jgi:hypothetical protein
MGLFKKASTNVAVIDIRSSSIGAAYATLYKNAAPHVVYSARIPLDPHATEPMADALPRTLDAVLNQLVKTGAPILHKASGSGRVEKVLVTFTAPWHSSKVYSRVIERDKQFLFTRQALEEALKEARPVEENHSSVSEIVIATLLNGYEVANPFNKRVKRAEMIVLASSLEDGFMELVAKAVRKALHQSHIEFGAFMPEAYGILRDIYPHQKDFLVLDVGNEATDLLLAKHGLLVSVNCIPHGVGEIARAARGIGLSSPNVPTAPGETSMIDAMRNTTFESKVEQAEQVFLNEVKLTLGALAKQEPLPRTVFLLAEESVRDFLKRLLDAPDLRSLWLSDESISIMPIQPVQFAPYIQSNAEEQVDPALALIVLSARKRFL